MSEHKLGELTVRAIEQADQSIGLLFFGESEAIDRGALRALFNGYFDKAIAHGLTLDFRPLEYLSSSTFPTLVELIRRLHDRGAALTVLYSKEKAWQRTPFKALSSIAEQYPNLTVRAC